MEVEAATEGPLKRLDDISSQLEHYRPRRAQRYVSVTVLILSWAASDIDLFDELKALECLFQESFRYAVQRWEIPSDKPQAHLGMFMSKFLLHFGGEDSLVIIYYGGHGGPAAKGRKECIWAAKIQGEPTLDWSAIQPQLCVADCDVVLFLDCCYAGQAFRGRTMHTVETLAATDSTQQTPVGKGGHPSFTRVLIQKLGSILHREGEVSISGLQREMILAEAGLARQPFYLELTEGSAGRVLLKRLNVRPTNVDSGYMRNTTVPSLSFEIYTFRPLDSTIQQALIRWLTRDSPSFIADITLAKRIVADVEASEKIGNYLLRPATEQLRGQPVLTDESSKAIEELLQNLKSMFHASSPGDLTHGEVLPILDALRAQSNKLIDTVEDLLSSFDHENLEVFQEDGTLDSAHLKDRVSMRLVLLDTDAPLAPTQIVFLDSQAKPEQRFRIGKQNGSEVLVEYCYYDEHRTTHGAISKQVARISALLMEPKNPAFRCLSGAGFVHERLHGPRFGFIHRRPDDRPIQKYAVLSDLIEQATYVPLEIRIGMAEMLCEAVVHLHSIGWYHKAIKSGNVLLFENDNASGAAGSERPLYGFNEPYLIGFDYSRPADAETRNTVDYTFRDNIYRHPDRWGRTLRFKRHHDTYALGLLLLEIGCWRPLPQMDPKRKGFEQMKDPEKLRDYLLDKVLGRLAHYAGTRYASAVRACLQRSNWNNLEDWQFQRFVREEVLDLLKPTIP